MYHICLNIYFYSKSVIRNILNNKIKSALSKANLQDILFRKYQHKAKGTSTHAHMCAMPLNSYKRHIG